MQRNRNAYSIDEASKAIKEAEKARKARKKEVDKQYEDDVIAIKITSTFLSLKKINY
ncbi:putative tail length tape measure domain protein [Staphylococcus aureus]|nr:putative tail length tape measure domain protein [Staphylococcus aureus]